MLLDYFIAGFVVLFLGALFAVALHQVWLLYLDLFPKGLLKRFYRWLFLKDYDFRAVVRQNRKLSPQEIMEREALRRGICPDCGVDAKKPGGQTALGGPCPYHTDF